MQSMTCCVPLNCTWILWVFPFVQMEPTQIGMKIDRIIPCHLTCTCAVLCGIRLVISLNLHLVLIECQHGNVDSQQSGYCVAVHHSMRLYAEHHNGVS